MVIYIAGKITGDPNYQYKFADAEMALTANGHTVLSPAWMPSSGLEYDQYIRIGQAMLRECDALVLLPDWKDSSGAKDEYLYAAELEKEIYFYEPDGLCPLLRGEIKTETEGMDNAASEV